MKIEENFAPYLGITEGDPTAVPNPDAGTERLLIDSGDHKLKRKNSSGTVTTIESTGAIGGSSGSTDNAVLRADGTGGATVQSSLMTVDDSGTPNIPTGQTYNINGSPHTHAGSGIATTRTTYASRASGSTTGDLWYASDSPYEARWNGTTWDMRCFSYPVIDPTLTTWGWINQGTATIDAAKGFLYLTDPTGTGLNFRIRLETITAGASVTRSVLLIPNVMRPVSFSMLGVCFRDSGSGRLSCVGWLGENNGEIGCIHAASATSDYSSAVTAFARNYWLSHPLWLQVQQDATNLTFRFSGDGQNWYDIRQEARTSYLTTAPDGVGFFIMGDSNMGAGYGVSIMSWG